MYGVQLVYTDNNVKRSWFYVVELVIDACVKIYFWGVILS